jgi:predicted O-methyltransferase YrrM
MNERNNVAALHDWGWAGRAAKVLQVANSLEIFTILSEGAISAEEICKRIKSKPEMTGKLLTACAAMGLLEREGGKYKNTQLAQEYLVRGGKLYQGDMIAHSRATWGFWDKLEEAIFSGAAAIVRGPQEHRNFIMAMHNNAVAGRAEMFLEVVDVSGRKKLFDVGGGAGTYSIAACRRYSELKAVLFDLPETIAIAREIIAEEQMQDRITLLEGNWDTDDFGEGNDVVLLSEVMHGADSQAEMKLKKAYDSMTAGGLVVIQEFLLNDEKTGPLIPALFNIMVGAYSKTELLGIIEKAGFTKARMAAGDEKIGSSWIIAKRP